MSGRTVTALALDYGERRIGVAIAQRLPGWGSARPLATLSSRDGEPDWPALEALIVEWCPDRLLVGLPYNADGSESAMTGRAREFAAGLAARYSLPVSLLDERLSSIEAEERLRAARASGRRTRRVCRGDVDREAACVLAEQWLNTEEPE